jgi:hypothetical protein
MSFLFQCTHGGESDTSLDATASTPETRCLTKASASDGFDAVDDDEAAAAGFAAGTEALAPPPPDADPGCPAAAEAELAAAAAAAFLGLAAEDAPPPEAPTLDDAALRRDATPG